MRGQVMDAVRDDFGPEPASIHTAGLKLVSSGREVIPALGPSWAACVNVRVFLSRAPVSDTHHPASAAQVSSEPSSKFHHIFVLWLLHSERV